MSVSKLPALAGEPVFTGEPAFAGILPAIASPCDAEDRFLEDTFGDLARDLYGQGIDGLYVCGATGDGLSMRIEERKAATRVAVEVSKPTHGAVIVHVGTTNSRDSMELAEHAASVGAAAVSSMPPANRSIEQLVSYYTDIQRASGLPVLVYHIPTLSGRSTSVEEMIQLLDIDGVVGLKFSDYNIFMMDRLLIERPDTTVLSGNDEIFVPALLYGAHGGIGMNYNLFPKAFIGIYRAVNEGNIVRAMELQKLIVGYVDVIFRYNLFKSFETIMQHLGKAPHSYRRPRPEMDKETARRFLGEAVPMLEAIDEATKDV